MGKQTRNTLKGYFETGKKPVGANYVDLLDSYLLTDGENTGSIDIQGSITASGDISASGTIYADTFQSHGSTEIGVSDSLNVTGGITASGGINSSGDISSSGFVSASSFSGDGSGLTNITASQLNIQQITASYISGSIQASGSLTYTSGSTTMLYAIQSSGSIIPDSSSTWDLGGPDHYWRDLFISEGSLRFVSSSGLISLFSQEDIVNMKLGKPVSADTKIGTYQNFIRPTALIHPTQDIPTLDLATAGRFKYTSMGGVMLDVYNDGGETNYIAMGKSDATTQVSITGSLEISGSSTFTNWGNFRNRFPQDDRAFEVSTDPTVAGGFREGLATPNTGSAPHLHFMLSGSGQAGIGLLNPEHTLHVSASSTNFNALQVEGDSQFNGFVGASAVGNPSTLSTTTVPANYNTILYGPITVGANAIFNIAVSAQVLVKDLASA